MKPPLSWADFPPTYAAILSGLRDELQGYGLLVGLQYANSTWGEEYQHGIVIFTKYQSHICSVYIHNGILTLVQAGGMGSRLIGDFDEFDLDDPDSIPRLVTTVLTLSHWGKLPVRGKTTTGLREG